MIEQPMIAFFDFDKTLIAINSGSLWVKRELQHGFLSWWDAMRASMWILQYQVGFAELDKGVREIIASLRGSKEAELAARISSFYAEQVRGLYRPGAKPVIEEHRQKGEKLVLLSSTSIYMGRAVAQELAFDDLLCNSFEVDNEGLYTGNPLGEICYGKGKLTIARAYAQQHGVDLASCAFYTDSMADSSLLEVVGRPVAVNPDPRLKRLARARGWPVADWGLPG
jgi:HAD superfamily hydrolase (TIGR01490 family)